MQIFKINPVLPWNTNPRQIPLEKPVLIKLMDSGYGSFKAIRMETYPDLVSPVPDHSRWGTGEVYPISRIEAWLDVDLLETVTK